MAKTLVIAEKPSVARDLAAALPGSYTQAKDKTHLVGDEYVITWAVGHLVGPRRAGRLRPEAEEVALRRPADRARASSSSCPTTSGPTKQLKAIHRLMTDTEIERIVNACDAGREGELIFAYVFETAEGGQAGRAALAVLDDEAGDHGGVRAACAPARR